MPLIQLYRRPASRSKIRNSNLRVAIKREKNRERGAKGGISAPLIKQKMSRFVIIYHKLGMSSKDISGLNQGSPKLRAVVRQSQEETRGREILSLKNVKPQSARRNMQDLPPPLNH